MDTASGPRTTAGISFIEPTKRATNALDGLRYTSVGLPSCSIWPFDITPTRSLMASASSWSWVTNSVVMPTSVWMRRISSRNVARTLASSALSGSSSSSTCGGWPTPARAPRVVADHRRSGGRSGRPWARAARARASRATSLPLGLGDPAGPQAVLDVAGDREVGEQAVALEHHSHVALVRRLIADVVARHHHPSRCRRARTRRRCAAPWSCRSRWGRAG